MDGDKYRKKKEVTDWKGTKAKDLEGKGFFWKEQKKVGSYEETCYKKQGKVCTAPLFSLDDECWPLKLRFDIRPWKWRSSLTLSEDESDASGPRHSYEDEYEWRWSQQRR